MKKYFLFMLFSIISWAAMAQDVQFNLVITDKDRITDYDGGIPIFEDANINDIFDNYDVTYFAKAYPLSDFAYLHMVYRIECDSIGLAEELYLYDSLLFPSYTQIDTPKVHGYYPQDWASSHNDTVLFKFIKADSAWLINKGDTNTIIGVTDTYFLESHEDMQGKYAHVRSNVFDPNISKSHGSFVAGLIAAETDNDTFGTTGMGFNCRLNVSTEMEIDELLKMVKDTQNVKTRILSSSWGPQVVFNYYWAKKFGSFDHQGVMHELYERGVVNVFSAGNGKTIDYPNDKPYHYIFPASYDYVLSISSVGHLNTSGNDNIEYMHERYPGDSIASEGTHQHNSRVDLCAPGYQISSHYNDGTNGKYYSYREYSGTSFSAPLVAGTVGLMRSKMPWITPYQVEYVLKKSSIDIYNLTHNGQAYNQKYAGATRWTGRLGAGALNAHAALDSLNVDSFIADYPATATFRIKGIKLNNRCVPGSHLGVDPPRIEVVMENGTPPYRYKWEEIWDNNIFITDQYDSVGTTTKITCQIDRRKFSMYPWYLHYRLTVYDNSDIEKVATKTIQLTFTDSSKWQLVMQDAYADMYDEPNMMLERNPSDWDIWTSPDVWNRHAADNDTIHENPDTTVTNYMHVRIKNIGCIPSPNSNVDSAHVLLYWTLASTGEEWPADWLGTSPQINGHDVGDLINPGGTAIPSILPGGQTIINEPWLPPNPHDYDTTGTLDTIEVCALARIITDNTAPSYGMTFTEIDTTKINVRENNKIVTRNFVSIYPPNGPSAPPRSTGVVIGNPSSTGSGTFTVQFITENQLLPYVAGHLASYLEVTIHMGGLYDVWDNGGKEGNATEYDDGAKTVTWDMEQELRLANISLNHNERYYVIIDFQLKDGVSIPYEIKNQLVHLRLVSQETVDIDNGDGTTFEITRDHVHSAVNYAINIPAEEGGEGKPGKTNNIDNLNLQDNWFEVYPNPVNGRLTLAVKENKNTVYKVSVTDISGKVVFNDDKAVFTNSKYSFNTNALVAGSYFVTIRDNTGKDHTKKFVKVE